MTEIKPIRPFALLALSQFDEIALSVNNKVTIIAKDQSPWVDAINTAAPIATVFSPDSKYFAVATEDKVVSIFEKEECETPKWICLNRYRCPKRASILAFAPFGKCLRLLVADKAGIVYYFPTQRPAHNSTDSFLEDSTHRPSTKANGSVKEPIEVYDGTEVTEDGEYGPALGHFGMITDMAVNWKYSRVLTGDRDGRIKVSRLPNSWIMEGSGFYGHEGVTRVAWADNIILAGGWDGKLVTWDINGGDVLSEFRIEGGGNRSVGDKDNEREEAQAGRIITGLAVRIEDGLIAVVWGKGKLDFVSLKDRNLSEQKYHGVDPEILDGISEIYWTKKGYLLVARTKKPFIEVFSLTREYGEEVKVAFAGDYEWLRSSSTLSLIDSTATAQCSATLEKFGALRKREYEEDWKGKKKRRTDEVVSL